MQQARIQQNFPRQSGYSATTPFHSVAAGNSDHVYTTWLLSFRSTFSSLSPLTGSETEVLPSIVPVHSVWSSILRELLVQMKTRIFSTSYILLNVLANLVRLSICIGQFSGNISYPVAQPGSSIRIRLHNWTVLCCPVPQPGNSIHVRFPNRATLFASGCLTRQLSSRPVA